MGFVNNKWALTALFVVVGFLAYKYYQSNKGTPATTTPEA